MKNPILRRTILLALPVFLFASMLFIFRLSLLWLGREAGYLCGFAFYWLFWCTLVPFVLLGKQGLARFLKDKETLFTRRNWLATFLWLLVMIASIFMYIGGFVRAPFIMILLSIPLATVNGVCEENLWRGLYVRFFPGNPWLAVFYPAVGFALWHFAPQTVIPDGGGWGFILSTLFLGLAYGFIAYRTGSARWTALSHSLSGILALSGWLATSLLSLIAGQ